MLTAYTLLGPVQCNYALGCRNTAELNSAVTSCNTSIANSNYGENSIYRTCSNVNIPDDDARSVVYVVYKN